MARNGKGKPYQREWLEPNRNEIRATAFSNNPEERAKALIGRVGKTTTPLKPAGGVRVEGKIFDAITEEGFIAAHERVKVIGLRDFKLVVRTFSK